MVFALTSTFPALANYTTGIFFFRRNHSLPSVLQQKLVKLARKPTLEASRTSHKVIITIIIMALKKPKIEGVSDELNAIAAENMDYAPARRRVRSAFIDVQQQLDHILFKMAPTDIRMEERYEVNSKGEEIFCKSWFPQPGRQIKGSLYFCHGYGDTCTFFFEGIAKHIAASGYGVYAIDYPGFGLSEGLHGYVPDFDGLVDNVIEQYTKIKGRPGMIGLPRILFGQSMGGAVALKALLKEPHKWDGIILVAPMVKIAEEMTPPVPLQKILILLSRVIPKAKLVPQKDLAELAFRELKKRHMVASPMLILHGAADKVTDPRISQYLYENASSKDKALKLYEDGYHSILEGEPDDRIYTVLNDIISWLDSRCLAK